MIDFDKAAVMAAQTLVKYEITKAPVSVLSILKQMKNVVVVSFSEVSDTLGIERSQLVPMFDKKQDAITSLHKNGDFKLYVVAYNKLLPFNIIQHSLARELGHILLKHECDNADNAREAETFSNHLLFPRALIHILEAAGMKITENVLSDLTGANEQAIRSMRRVPKTDVPAGLNSFVRNQFMPFFLNYFDYHRYVLPRDESAIADLGTYMNGYEE